MKRKKGKRKQINTQPVHTSSTQWPSSMTWSRYALQNTCTRASEPMLKSRRPPAETTLFPRASLVYFYSKNPSSAQHRFSPIFFFRICTKTKPHVLLLFSLTSKECILPLAALRGLCNCQRAVEWVFLCEVFCIFPHRRRFVGDGPISFGDASKKHTTQKQTNKKYCWPSQQHVHF